MFLVKAEPQSSSSSMHRSVFVLVALVLINGICLADVSNDSGSSEEVEPAHAVDHLYPKPEDFLKRGKVYTLYCDDQVDFFKAWRHCMGLKQELATIESSRDNEAFAEVVKQQDLYNTQIWTSGTNLGCSEHYVWLTNSRRVTGWNEFAYWKTGEPNNADGVEHCMTAALIRSEEGVERSEWNDENCADTYCYMCQYYRT